MIDRHPPVAEPAAETLAVGATSDTPRLTGAADDFGFAAAGNDPLLGAVLGDVTLVRFVAEGGMGRVYEGRQRIGFAAGAGRSPEERPVAVKLIRNAVASPGLVTRFDAEARLLARLDHPGIARIHAVGEHAIRNANVPFIVMEFIPDARPLIEYCTVNRLPVRQRLAVFREVCSAVAHGHLRGVIHRDLKPGNILVAGSGPLAGRPRVIDFGIARATDADATLVSRQTELGQLLGTLPYMSPEQLAGEPDRIDVRADVYALGAVLYELLAGRLPHDVRRKPVPEAIRIVHERDPIPLDALDRRLGRELAAIAGKCLEREPERRYSSAAELAADVERYLEGRPVQASPPGFFAGLVRLARRHRAAAAATLVSLAALVVAAVGIGLFAVTAQRQRQAAERATARADRGRAAAEDLVRFMTFSLRDSLQEIGRLDLLAGVLAELDRYHATSRALAAEGLEQLSPEQRRRWEVFLNMRGDLERAAGRPAGARAAYEEALGIARELAAETPASLEWQRDLSVSHQKLGMLAAEEGDADAARRHFREAQSIRQRLVTLAPDDPTRLWDLAGIEDRLGELAFEQGDLESGREHFAELRRLVGDLVAIEPASVEWRRGLAITLRKLGDLERRADSPAVAREHYAEALALAERLFEELRDPRGIEFQATLLEALADCHRRSGDESAAAACEARQRHLTAGTEGGERGPR
jgi:tetratricopeptide (TPR) repeat protein